MSWLDIIATTLIAFGLFFFLGGAIGILRIPDFYSRLHPAGKLDPMGQFAAMLGMAIYLLNDLSLGSVLTALKIVLIVVFVFITSPTATHAIVDAGVRAGMPPWSKETGEGSR